MRIFRRSRNFRLVLALGTASLAGGPMAGAAQSGISWRPEERVVISAFNEVGAVAADLLHVYGGTPNGLIVYDHGSNRWLPPITSDDGFPTGELPTALAVDPFSDGLWVGMRSGALYRWSRLGSRWESYGIVSVEPILRLLPGADMMRDDLFVRTRSGWTRLRRGSGFPEPATPQEIAAASRADAGARAERDPVFQSLRATIARDADLRLWPVASVAPGLMSSRLWLGTLGGGLFRFDATRGAAEPVPFGLLSQGVGALALDADAIWFGGDGRGPRRGVTRGSVDLQRWQQYDAESAGAPAGRVKAVLPTTDAAWFGSSDGLFRFDRASGRWQRATERDGLPHPDVRALVRLPSGELWIGTRAGPARILSGGTVVSTIAHGSAISDFALRGSSLWIASDAGLWSVDVDSLTSETQPRLSRSADVEAIPALRGRVTALAASGDVLWAATEAEVYRHAGGVWAGPFRGTAAIGRIHSMAGAGDRLWVAGENGVAQWNHAASPDAAHWSLHLAGQDLPLAPVTDILPLRDALWVATGAGAVRLDGSRWP